MDVPVDPALVADLYERIPDFRRAYDPDGMTPDEFEGFGASARTLRTFVKSYHDLQARDPRPGPARPGRPRRLTHPVPTAAPRRRPS